MKKIFLIALSILLTIPSAFCFVQCSCVKSRNATSSANYIVYQGMLEDCYNNNAEQACFDGATAYYNKKQAQNLKTFTSCCSSLKCC